jgi:flagellar basal-body rod protein FlgC
MAAQRQRAEVLVENIANSETTRTPDGGPYRRKDAVFSTDQQNSTFSAVFQTEMEAAGTGVKVSEISVDQSAPEMRYMPGHPDANKDGYVAFPHVNPAEDMVDLMSANRNHQANVVAMTAVKDMIQKSISLLG